jgi:FkbM family methyltransferase
VTNSLKQVVKAASVKLGVYPHARHIYRRVHPTVQRDAAAAKKFYSTVITPGSLVFDIGANLGQMAEIFLGLGARVVALEPNTLCAPTLAYEFHGNPDMTLVKEAVGAEKGVAQLQFAGTASTASLRTDWKWLAMNGARQIESCTVQVTTLDALVARYGAPDYCKIDVEGFELECLRGLSQALPLLSYEYHIDEIDVLGACLGRLGELGPLEVNVTNMNHDAFLFEDWLGPDEILEKARTSQIPDVGDVFVCPRA